VSVERLDSPRTDPHRGYYEHELRFIEAGTLVEPWCTGDYDMLVSDLPQGAYHDDTADNGEYTWGMAGWRVEEDHVYDLDYECENGTPTIPNSNEVSYRGQIGHCHFSSPTPCFQFQVYSDNSGLILSRIHTRAPTTPGASRVYSTRPSYDDNVSFESDPAATGWSVFSDGVLSGGPVHKCPGTQGTFHAQCYARAIPDSPNARAWMKFSLIDFTSPTEQRESYVEGWGRCPVVNDDKCRIRLKIEGLPNNGGNLEETDPAIVLDPDGEWVKLDHLTHTFDSGTDVFNFGFLGGPGDTIDIDYHQAYQQNEDVGPHP
jgi:hypothetical protein